MRNLLLPVCLAAVAAYAQSPQVTASVSAPTKGPAEVSIRNHGALEITAYAYTVNYTAAGKPGSKDEFWDSASALDLRTLQPNTQALRKMPGVAGATNVTVDLHAAIFADGSTFGDSGWVNRILDHRRAQLKTLDAIRDQLTAAGSSKPAHDAAMAKLQSAKPQGNLGGYYTKLLTRLSKSPSPESQLQELALTRAKLAASLPSLGTN